MEPDARVCPFCGEPPGSGVFCAACGRNLGGLEQLPTRGEWEARSAATDPVEAFVAAMHAAGDPGVTRHERAEPGFLGRTLHAEGWVLREIAFEGDDDLPGDYEPGLFLTVDGVLHRLDRSTRGMTRERVRHLPIVGAQVDPADDPGLAGELTAVLRANGLGA